ncbi:glycerate kinase family protein [Yaniella halotolerans]|uniref:glycerate kinase family protein n=1 Tax=Yaniella halotolerans TaxID=225453 RepID=UPI0003B6F1DD|nr:glycerate kinase [Yaniella halotolerans]
MTNTPDSTTNPLNILLVPDSFKGSLSSIEAARALAVGIRRAAPAAHLTAIPMADGGEGTVDALVTAANGEWRELEVTGPEHRPVTAAYGQLTDGAVVEMAAAAGLPLTTQPNPETTTTYGVGELINHLGAQNLTIGAGGSATNDLGCGAAAACGAIFYDDAGQEFVPTGATLQRIVSIDVSMLRCPAEITVMTDIDNPLLGENGAAAIFAPQKGAGEAMVQRLESGAAHAAKIIDRDVGVDVTTIAGGGAAGGFAAGMYAFFGAQLRPGIDAVLDAVGFDDLAAQADLILTGEGQLDGQSLAGKVPVGVARRTDKPVIAVVGSVGEGASTSYAHGITAVFGITPKPQSLEAAFAETAENLAATAESILRTWLAAASTAP